MNQEDMIKMDSYLVLSIMNTKLRDRYPNLDDLCEDLNYEKELLEIKMKTIGYVYSSEQNQFIPQG